MCPIHDPEPLYKFPTNIQRYPAIYNCGNGLMIFFYYLLKFEIYLFFSCSVLTWLFCLHVVSHAYWSVLRSSTSRKVGSFLRMGLTWTSLYRRKLPHSPKPDEWKEGMISPSKEKRSGEKNSAYGRQWISWPMPIVSPLSWREKKPNWGIDFCSGGRPKLFLVGGAIKKNWINNFFWLKNLFLRGSRKKILGRGILF